MLSPHLESLPEPQQRLWPELKDTPKTFVLYGGTAIALYLGHRQSEDFDFFASEPFNPTTLLQQLPYLRGAQVQQQQPNTLTCLLDRGESLFLVSCRYAASARRKRHWVPAFKSRP